MKPLSMPDTDIDRVRRGGCWYESMRYTRGAYRIRRPSSSRYGNVGFRSCWTIR